MTVTQTLTATEMENKQKQGNKQTQVGQFKNNAGTNHKLIFDHTDDVLYLIIGANL